MYANRSQWEIKNSILIIDCTDRIHSISTVPDPKDLEHLRGDLRCPLYGHRSHLGNTIQIVQIVYSRHIYIYICPEVEDMLCRCI